MLAEFSALIKTKTWELVLIIFTCMWLFRHKYNAYGDFKRYKARLVMNGKN